VHYGDGVLSTAAEERDRVIGVGIAALLVRMNTGERRDGWVHIRVERLSLLDASTIRHEITVDLTYPTNLTPVAQMVALTPPLLPLTLFTKGARLAGFSVHDEDERRHPVLTRVESTAESARCLRALARTIAEDAGQELPTAVVDAFEQVAILPGLDACDLLGRMRVLAEQVAGPMASAEKFGPAWRGFVPSRHPSAQVEKAGAALLPHRDVLWTLLKEPTLNTLARGLATQFMLLTPLPPELLAQRRTLSYGYDLEYRQSVRGDFSATKRRTDAVRESLGWKAGVYWFEVPGVGRAQRYQLEVLAPPSLQIVFAELLVLGGRGDAGPGAGAVADPAAPRAPVPRVLWAAWNALKAPPAEPGYRAPVPRALAAAIGALRRPRHPAGPILRLTTGASESLVALQPACDLGGASQGVATVGFQPSHLGLLRVAPPLGSLIAIVLLIGRARLSSIHSDVASALLLVVPVVFAALVTRPGEHGLSTRLLIGARLLVSLTGLAAFVAAASLAVSWSHRTQHLIWDWAAWSAVAATALVWMGLAVNRRRWRRGFREVDQEHWYPG
jgi:hypothetical protein